MGQTVYTDRAVRSAAGENLVNGAFEVTTAGVKPSVALGVVGDVVRRGPVALLTGVPTTHDDATNPFVHDLSP